MDNKQAQERFVLPAAGKRPGEHNWTPGSDVQSLWKRFGWTPPSEVRQTRALKSPSENSARPPLNILRG